MIFYAKSGKKIDVPDEEINKIALGLGVSFSEAVQIWLEDAEYEINEEQEALDASAKKVKVNHGAEEAKRGPKKGTPRNVKVSNEKKELFDTIVKNLDRCWGVSRENIKILKENKLIEVTFNDKTFKIDIIECRKMRK